VTAAPKTTKHRLSAKQWAEAEALWESGTVTYEDLMKKFGLAQSSFERHFKKTGTVKGARAAAIKAKVDEKLATAAIDEATVIAARIKETKEQHYTMSANLSKLAYAEILQAKKDGHPVAVALNNLKALDKAMDVLAKGRAERYAILGLDRPDAVNPDELPELVISELTAEQIEELRKRDEADLDEVPTGANQNAVQADEVDDDLEDDGDAVVEES
jgi:DNA-binding transcriptional ArsR family regulator